MSGALDKPLGPLDTPTGQILDERFEGCLNMAAPVERLWTGGIWTEGPAWFRQGYLVWSDIPNNRMLRWDEASGAVSIFRQPSNRANGNTVDREGRLVTCEHDARRVTRTEHDGTITVLATDQDGRRFNAPNDVVVKSDGAVWFTDPAYGGGPDYEGAREIDGCHVYRLDPGSGVVTRMIDDMVMPNGLAFSPDESILYVVDTGSTHLENGPNHIRRFEVAANGALGGGEVFAENAAKSFDGLRIDRDGRLWCGAEDGAHVYDPDGTLIGKVITPERAANLTFGGADGATLFLTGTTSLYRARVIVRA